jgi:hypothetical protein
MGRSEELMAAGYEAGLQAAPEILELIEAAGVDADFSKDPHALSI